MQEKETGNLYFKEKKYSLSVKYYNRAISLEPKEAMFYCNRFSAYLHLWHPHLALDDAERAIQLDSKRAKSHYKKAQALKKLSRGKDAIISTAKLAMELNRDKDLDKEIQRFIKVFKKERYHLQKMNQAEILFRIFSAWCFHLEARNESDCHNKISNRFEWEQCFFYFLVWFAVNFYSSSWEGISKTGKRVSEHFSNVRNEWHLFEGSGLLTNGTSP